MGSFATQASCAAQDYVHILFIACSVNPYSFQSQAMSGFGVGSEEMLSAVLDQDQLPKLQLLTNDLRVKLGYVISTNINCASRSDSEFMQCPGARKP